jgi:hypothetical protein
VKIILSLSLAARTVLLALIAGFVFGVVVGYRAGESAGGSQSPAGSPNDARASSLVVALAG